MTADRTREIFPASSSPAGREGIAPGVSANAAEPSLSPPDAPLHELFRRQVARNPAAPALTFDGTGMTYAELDARSTAVARRLVAAGVGRETLVGLFMERSLELVTGLVAILKAGAAYVPLDPAYPAERIRFMLDDTQTPLVLTQRALRSKLPSTPAAVMCVDDPPVANEADHIHLPDVDADQLAYCIYTSGSTGRPKGCLVTHRNVTRLFAVTEPWFHFHAGDVWTLFHSFAFDFSVWEIWGALLYGGRLVVVPFMTSRDPAAFLDLLHRERVTVLNQTPSAFRGLMHADAQQPCPLDLRYIIFGGETLDFRALRPWFERHGDTRPQLVNMYGITETTVHVTWRPLTASDTTARGSLIGRPLPDLQLHILNAQLEPVGEGVTGEIYVGGAGVARGYLNRPELTAERFIPDPFAQVPGVRLYKTGDLARRLPGGEIEYLGRMDAQVKIRGFRIEPGEIEAALEQHPRVRQAAVVAREDGAGQKRLVAYVVTDPPHACDGADLRRFCQSRLPDHMVPAACVVLAAFPLTVHGKIDRSALPDPVAEKSPHHVAPRSALERRLAAIWQEVIPLAAVGVHDNFFEVGGNSLKLVEVHARLNRELGRDLPVTALFQYPTIALLARFLEGQKAGPAPAVSSGASERARRRQRALAAAGRFLGKPRS